MHIAVICPPFPSHVSTLEALAQALAARGCRTTLVQRPEVARFVSDPASLGFAPVELEGAPPLAEVVARAARPSGPFGVRRVVADMASATRALCRQAPGVLRALGADAVIADQLEPAGGLVAERLGLPFVSVACALPIEPEPALPPPVLGWGYDPSPGGLRRNRGGHRVSDLLLRPLYRVIEAEAAAAGLARGRIEECLSPLAAIWQLVPALDFPRAAAPEQAHYVGPLRRPGRTGRLDLEIRGGRPLVYASFGTLQGHRLGLFRRIAAGCRSAGVELVVSHCGGLSPRAARRVGADHVVAGLAQRAMIARADLVITHGGLNTVLDAAEAGVPVLALPIAFDQPGVAARVAFAGLGLRLDRRLATTGAIARAARRLLSEPGYRAAARRIGGEIRQAGGAARAAAIVEQALRTGRPVRRAAA